MLVFDIYRDNSSIKLRGKNLIHSFYEKYSFTREFNLHGVGEIFMSNKCANLLFFME